MPMPQRVQYSADIEPLVQFIEDTPPAEILDRTLEKLRAGVPIPTMLMASALAVTRSTEMPPGHHGGPLHPLAGLYPVTKLVERLEGEQRYLPVLQHVALSNKHINHPAMGPYQLLEYEPHDVGDFEAAKAAWLMAVGRGEWNLADHLFLSLWQTAPAIEVFDLLMSVAITKNWNDDHYFMFPGAMWRAFETGVLDKAYLPLLMRPVVRYVTRSAVLPLNPVPNPMDVHLHTSVNLRRYLLRLDGLSVKTKLLLLLTWHTGPEIRSTANRMEPAPQPDMAAVAALPPRSQADLLDAITHSIYHQPPTDWSTVTN